MSQHQEVLPWEEVVAADVSMSVFMSSGLKTGETISPTPAESIVSVSYTHLTLPTTPYV